MTDQPARMSQRPSAAWTARTLTGGTLASAACFTIGAVVALVGSAEDARRLSTAAVLVLLATPVCGLVVTVFELRRAQRFAALMAVGTLAILGAAVLMAVLGLQVGG